MRTEGLISLLGQLGIARSFITVSDGWVSCSCPFAKWTHAKRSDSSASFGVSVVPDGRSGYNCMACGEHGNLLGLIERLSSLTGKDYSDASALVEDQETYSDIPSWDDATTRSGLLLPDPIDEEEFDSIFDPARKSKAAVGYFKRRGLSLSSMRRFDLRWDAYRKRILFKAKLEGVMYGASGRSVLPNAKNKVRVYNYPKAMFLLGEELVEPDRPTVVIEGLMGLPELDSCNLFDYANAVALQGSAMSMRQRDRLVELGNPVVLLLDPDQAGRDGTFGKRLADGRMKPGALSMLSGLIEVSVAEWPEGVTDLAQLTGDVLHRIIMESNPFDSCSFD